MKKIYLNPLLIAIFLFLTLSCDLSENTDIDDPVIVEIDSLQIDPVCRESFKLRRRSNLNELLTKQMGIEPEAAYQITQVAKDSIDMRKMKPSDKFYAIWSDSGSIREIIYIPYKSEIKWHIKLTPLDSLRDSIHVFRKAFPIQSERIVITRTISDNLYNAFVPEFHPDFIYQIADILQWDIDFLTDPRIGDEISILLEQSYSPDYDRTFNKIYGIAYAGARDTVVAVYDTVTQAFFDMEGNSVQKTFLRSPLRYRRISSSFNRKRFHPIKKIYRPHNGVDFAAPRGTPVSSSADGIVEFKGWKNGFGNTLIIRHGHIYKTLYGHLLGYKRGIRKGKRIKQGETIGFAGKTGTATGYHLHYTFYLNGRPRDPMKIKNPAGGAIADSLNDYFISHADSIYHHHLK